MQKYLTFPPPGNQPHVSKFEPNATCDTLGLAYDAIYTLNPCFNVYHITDVCPFPSDRLVYNNPWVLQPYVRKLMGGSLPRVLDTIAPAAKDGLVLQTICGD